jgi:hypothetical protein
VDDGISGCGEEDCPLLGQIAAASVVSPGLIVGAWEIHGSLAGHSPDTRRIRAVDNFQAPGGASSLRRASQYKPGLRSGGGRHLGFEWTRQTFQPLYARTDLNKQPVLGLHELLGLWEGGGERGGQNGA